MSATNNPSVSSKLLGKKESTATSASATAIDLNSSHECVTFVWLDLRRESNATFVGALRVINDCVLTYVDKTSCVESIRSTHQTIFFISSSSDVELLNDIHQCPTVEAIAILDPESAVIRGDFPKLIGTFTQQEELLRVLRETLDAFEQIQLERFTVETDKFFLWWQLWKEDVTNKKSTVNSKTDLIEQARHYYRTNPKRLKIVDEFERTYRPNDALRWCFRSPFPSRSLRYALLSHTDELLSSHRSLVTDVSRLIQQQSKASGHGQLFRGMKLSSELVDMFDAHTDKLVCVNGFFMCSKARNVELQLATSPGYRMDLTSVLFKIDFDASARFVEVAMDNGAIIVVFDVATSFRVICVNRGTMTIIKLKAAIDDGRKIALLYKENNKGKTVQMLLDEIATPPKPPTPPPPPPPKIEPKKESILVNDLQISEDELQARKYLERGDIDRAIMAYRRIRPLSVRILKLIARLSTDEKHDYDTAIECYELALKMQDKTDKDFVDTLMQLGTCYYRRDEYRSALDCHMHALSVYESARPRDENAMATCLTAVANAHRAQKELSEALDFAQRAWTLCESTGCENEIVVANSLTLLANIHHDRGDYAQAVKLGGRALDLLERTRIPDPFQTSELLNILGLAQMKLNELTEARHYFERALKIYSHKAPLGETERIEVERNLQYVLEMQQNTDKLQHYS